MSPSSFLCRIRWPHILTVCSILYLGFEFAFNARLLDLTRPADRSLSSALLHSVEIEGRTLSGIGLSLVVLGLISRLHLGRASKIAASVIAVAICFPLMFYGQRVLVDSIADRTSGKDRQSAQIVSIFKDGLIHGNLEIADLPFTSEDAETARGRSLISILGLMAYTSADLVDRLYEDSNEIIDHLAEAQSQNVLPEMYEQYKIFQKSTDRAWGSYREASAQFDAAVAKVRGTASGQWQEVQAELAANYAELQGQAAALSSYETLRELRTQLSRLFSHLDRCRDDECRVGLKARYDEQINETFGKTIEATYWCGEPTVQMGSVTLGSAIRTTRTVVQDCKSLPYADLEVKLNNFVGAVSYDTYLDLPEVRASVLERFAEAEIEMPDEWQLEDGEGFIQSATHTKVELLRIKFRQNMIETTGHDISPGLSADEFIALPIVQDPYREAMKLPADQVVPMGLAPDAFLASVLKPIYVRYGEQQREELRASAELFENGGEHEAQGKSAVRSLVIPPIAIAFSLIFATLNLIALLSTAAKAAAGPRVGALTYVGLLVAAVVVPLGLASATRSSGYAYFESEFRSQLGPVSGPLATWVINAEPLAYPLGRLAIHLTPNFHTTGNEPVASET